VAAQSDLPELLKELAAQLGPSRRDYPHRIASRVGERIFFLDLSQVTHFVARDKLTYAIVNGHSHARRSEHRRMESRLDPARFLPHFVRRW